MLCLHVCLCDGASSWSNSCELPCKYRELNPGPLEEQMVLCVLSLACLDILFSCLTKIAKNKL